jgi:hypothetical protein
MPGPLRTATPSAVMSAVYVSAWANGTKEKIKMNQ